MSEVSLENFLKGEVEVLEQGRLIGRVLPWQLTDKVSNVVKLKVNDVFQRLSTMEADASLINWFQCLAVNGKLVLEVPNLAYYFHLWENAQWDETTLKDSQSDARLAFSGVYGKQAQCNPKLEDYSSDYSDVFKSGYNKARLTFLLERVGFVDISVIENDRTLVANATKSMMHGERQITPDLSNIRLDHQNRYNFACQQLKDIKANKVLDLACGIGYGSLMIAKATNAKVTGMDIDSGAIDYANQYYSNNNTTFICADARKLEVPDVGFDAIVSFETIEHIDFDVELLSKFFHILKPGGTLICSTPNEEVMPFSINKFKYHIRHYTPNQIKALLNEVGFTIEEEFTQCNAIDAQVTQGSSGHFSVFKCLKL